MRRLIFILTLIIFNAVGAHAAANDKYSLYPFPQILFSDKVNRDSPFRKAISDNIDSSDVKLFKQKFKKKFQNTIENLQDKDRFNAFVAFVNVTRVSEYEVRKFQGIVDYYFPVTMSISFANVATGEIIYSSSATSYDIYRRSGSSISEADKLRIYKEKYDDLLNIIIDKAAREFQPFTISTTVKKKWKDYYILDKGKDKGIVDGDTLVDQHGGQLSIIYATLQYSIGKELLSSPKPDSLFQKFSNESIDQIKKPRIMLLADNDDSKVDVPQLFQESLGEKAPFLLVSVQENAERIRRMIPKLTDLGLEHSEQRQLPDYFLRVYLHGPFTASIPSNKSYAYFEENNIMACAEIMDTGGRIVYSKCVEDKRKEEVLFDRKFTKEAGEEIVVKNSLYKLGNDLINNVKFRDLELPVTKAEKNGVILEDKYNVLTEGINLKIFTNVGQVNGIGEKVYVPTWEIEIFSKSGNKLLGNKNVAFSPSMPDPQVGDVAYLSSVSMDTKEDVRVLNMRNSSMDWGGNRRLDIFKNLTAYGISGSTKYPICEAQKLKEETEKFSNPRYGFRELKVREIKTRYCVEPVWRIVEKGKYTDKNNQFDSYVFTILAGIKIYDGDQVIWKKGVEQDVKINTPKGDSTPFLLDSELSKYLFNLLKEVSKSIELKK